MRRGFSWFALVMILAAAAVPLRASSLSSIQVAVSRRGIVRAGDLRRRDLCRFVQGRRRWPVRHRDDAFAVTHQIPLPDPDQTKLVTGGLWKLQTLSGKTFSGIVTGGTLHNNSGDGTFDVLANMQIATGGSGGLTFTGALSHNTFPPTISGFIAP